MCGRFSLTTDHAALAEEFDLVTPEPTWHRPRWNVAPTQFVGVIRVRSGQDGGPAGRRFERMKWGLVPFWADDASIGNRMINARAETLASRNAFKRPFTGRRCLVPADGFYEWKKRDDGGKQPYRVHRADDRPIAFAGLWDRWSPDDAGEDDPPLESFTIITTKPNDALADLHDRMPAILPRDAWATWLDRDEHHLDRLGALLEPYPSDDLEIYPVPKAVGRPAFDEPACHDRVDEAPESLFG